MHSIAVFRQETFRISQKWSGPRAVQACAAGSNADGAIFPGTRRTVRPAQPASMVTRRGASSNEVKQNTVERIAASFQE